MKVANADLVGSDASMKLRVTSVAPTLGWTHVGLSPVIYIDPPQDGVQEVAVTGVPPSGPAAERLEVFELRMDLAPPAWLQGIRLTPVSPTGSAAGLTLHRPRLKTAAVGADTTFVGPLGVRGDKLIVPVAHSGGCAKHSFQLSWNGEIEKSLPPRVVLELSHDAHGDPCMMLVQDTLQFDLSVLKDLPDEEQLLVLKSSGVIVQTVRYTPPTSKTRFARPRCPDCYLDLRNWHAFHDTMPGSPPNLYVIGEVVVPSQDYVVGLKAAVPQGINPSILLLDLTVEAPKGPAGQASAIVPVRWDSPGPYDGRFTEVHVRRGSQVVLILPIEVVS